jgi:hypothetical protein
MFQKEMRSGTMDYIDVRYFEATSSELEPRVQAIVNEKLSAMGM